MNGECSFCGGANQVGRPGCNDSECKELLVCKYCDIDGSSYSGWCLEFERIMQ